MKTEQKKKERQQGWRIIQIAWLRDGEQTYTGEALSLACLLHTKGRGRDSKDMLDVQRIMRDQNLDTKDN